MTALAPHPDSPLGGVRAVLRLPGMAADFRPNLV